MKKDQHTPETSTALLCDDRCVDTPVKNSLCCEAAGITALLSSTTEVLTPHEKLRGAALADATLNAQVRPLAQPVVGYMHVSGYVDALPESTAVRRYWVCPKLMTPAITQPADVQGSQHDLV